MFRCRRSVLRTHGASCPEGSNTRRTSRSCKDHARTDARFLFLAIIESETQADFLVHVSASLQLARELFHLGMVTAAQSIHDSLAATLKSRDIQIPQELGVLVLLAQAEIASTSDLAEG